MRGVEQPADRLQVPAGERGSRGLDALVLGDHVPGAQRQRRVEAVGHVERGLAQAGDAERLARGRALGPPLVVSRASVRVSFAGVERHQPVAVELERHRLNGQRPEVDPQRAVALSEQRRELIQQAGLRADPIVLDPRAELRELDPIGLRRAGEPDQRERQRDLERRRGRQPGSLWHVAADLEPGPRHRDPDPLQLAHGAAHECAPARGRNRMLKLELVAFAQIGRDRVDPRLR